MLPIPAEAQQVRQLDLPAGSLQQAVIALGKQAGISIAIADPDLGRIRVKRIRGRLSADQALSLMLRGTRAGFVSLGGGNFRIVRAADRSPPRRQPDYLSARSEPEPGAQEIVVTGSKRDVRVRHYPGAVSIVGGDSLEAGAATAGTDAISEKIPTLGSTHLGPGRDKLFIRAIADSSFSGQTQATVGQYLGEARLTYNSLDPDLRLYDVGSIELLAGPQGTLYGAGSMGGVLRVIPQAPDPARASATLIGSAALTQHGDPSHEMAAILNLPVLEERAAIRLIGYDLGDGGYIDDVGRGEKDINRTRIRGGRATGLVQLGDQWSVEVGGLHQSIQGEDGQYAERGEPDWVRSGQFRQPFSNDYSLAYLTVRGRLGNVRLLSVASLADQHLDEQLEFTRDGIEPGLFRQQNRLSLRSAETRASRINDDGTGWIMGASLLENRAVLRRFTRQPGGWDATSGIRNRIEEQTLFGEWTLSPFGPVLLTGGLRVTHVHSSGRTEELEGMVPAAVARADQAEWRVLPSLSASSTIYGDVLAYVRYQESFRPGGLILTGNGTQELESDHIAAFEAGVRFGQGRGARFSGSLVLTHARWKNVQSDLIDSTGAPTTTNIGDGTIHTIEASVSWKPLSAFRMTATGAINRSRLTSSAFGIITLNGEPLPNVPRSVGRAEVEYRRPSSALGELRMSTWARYVGKSWLGVGPELGRPQGDYLDLGADIRIGSERRHMFLRATNLLDVAGNRFAFGSALSLVSEDQVTPLQPRTIRLGVQASF